MYSCNNTIVNTLKNKFAKLKFQNFLLQFCECSQHLRAIFVLQPIYILLTFK